MAVAGSTVRIARELPRGGQLKLLANGRIILCHSPCAYLELRYAREFGASGPDATGWRARLVAIEERERVAIATGNTAAEEAAFDEAVALERDVREAHRLYLGTDVADAGGRFRSLEADAAEHIEWNLGRPIERLDPEGNPNHRGKTGDWFDPARGQSYDAVGPSPRFDFAEFTASIEDHATKGGLDFVFVDLSGFTPQQQQRVIAFIRGPGLAPHLARTRRPFIKVFLSHERGLL